MNIKIKLIEKDTEMEIDNIELLSDVKDDIKNLIKEKYPKFRAIIKLYGEIIPLRR